MGAKTKIEWTDASWNALRGCTRVSAGCVNCYAESMAARFCGVGLPYEGTINPKTKRWNGKVRLVPEKLTEPLRWQRPRMVFVNSMSDLFHKDVPDEFIDQVFAVMAQASQHTFQVLTKRPERMRNYMIDGGMPRRVGSNNGFMANNNVVYPWPLPNVWLGTTVENQETADERIPLLLQTPAAVRWVSMEPLLGAVDLHHIQDEKGFTFDSLSKKVGISLQGVGLDWVVVGGESGTNARPMHPAWARILRDQCAEAGVQFLFKQWGEWAPNWNNDDFGNKIAGSEWMDKQGKKIAGRMLDGVLHDGYPNGSEA